MLRVEELANARKRFFTAHKRYHYEHRSDCIYNRTNHKSASNLARFEYVALYIDMYLNDRSHCPPIFAIKNHQWQYMRFSTGFNDLVGDMMEFAFPIATETPKDVGDFYYVIGDAMANLFPK